MDSLVDHFLNGHPSRFEVNVAQATAVLGPITVAVLRNSVFLVRAIES